LCEKVTNGAGGSALKVRGFGDSTASFEILGIVNPFSTRPVGPFTVKVFDSSDRVIQKYDAGSSLFLSTSEAANTQKVRII
jgi:hypothetical protein